MHAIILKQIHIQLHGHTGVQGVQYISLQFAILNQHVLYFNYNPTLSSP